MNKGEQRHTYFMWRGRQNVPIVLPQRLFCGHKQRVVSSLGYLIYEGHALKRAFLRTSTLHKC